MKLTFWLCFALTTYAYFGYAIWLWLIVRLHKGPILRQPHASPTVSIIIAARNEEANLPAKLDNLGHPPSEHSKQPRRNRRLGEQPTGIK